MVRTVPNPAAAQPLKDESDARDRRLLAGGKLFCLSWNRLRSIVCGQRRNRACDRAEPMTSGVVRPIEWCDQRLRLLDQTRLPAEERWVEPDSVDAVAEAIESMQVRGAPAIGIVAAAGMAIAAREAARSGGDLRAMLGAARERLLATRPTAVNLRWGLDRAMAAADGMSVPAAAALDGLIPQLLDEQLSLERALAEAGAELFPSDARVLTHCNTGPLATGGYGTALGVIRAAAERGGVRMVYADETRPRLQGARLTAWELDRLGLPYRVIPDGAAAALMARGEVDVVVVGADRIAANGDVANKIGTYSLAIAAGYHGLPFYVAAPVSTIDPTTASGQEIPIEQRSETEVHSIAGQRLTPTGARALNPAFDVTPAALVSGIVTERGILRPPYRPAISEALALSETPIRTVG